MTRSSDILKLVVPDKCPNGLTPTVAALIDQIATDLATGNPKQREIGIEMLTKRVQEKGPESLRALMGPTKALTLAERVAQARIPRKGPSPF